MYSLLTIQIWGVKPTGAGGYTDFFIRLGFRVYTVDLPPTPATAAAQAIAQDMLAQLLDKVGPSVLVGHGSGCTLSLLAADRAPGPVEGIVALQPPASRVFQGDRHGVRYRAVGPRPARYGVSEAPLAYCPSGAPHLVPVIMKNGLAYMLQYSGKDVIMGEEKRRKAVGCVRRLPNMAMPVLVVSGPESHSGQATAVFLRQAGVAAEWLCLDKECGVAGDNGLWKHSDLVAANVLVWIFGQDKARKVHTDVRPVVDSAAEVLAAGFGGVAATLEVAHPM